VRPDVARFSAAEAIILTGIALLCLVTGIVMVSDWPGSSREATKGVELLRQVAGW
jgi:hypothetical protein